MSIKITPSCCNDLDIELIHLAFPERMSPEGQEFVKVHGLDNEKLKDLFLNAIDLGNGKVKIIHRCEQLADDGSCKIYATRPKICSGFDCSSRSDCDCKGEGRF